MLEWSATGKRLSFAKVTGSLVADSSVDHAGKNVKGSNDLLCQGLEPEFVGIRQTSVGFEALPADLSAARNYFKDRAVVEKAALEDIMLYTTKEVGKC